MTNVRSILRGFDSVTTAKGIVTTSFERLMDPSLPEHHRRNLTRVFKEACEDMYKADPLATIAHIGTTLLPKQAYKTMGHEMSENETKLFAAAISFWNDKTELMMYGSAQGAEDVFAHSLSAINACPNKSMWKKHATDTLAQSAKEIGQTNPEKAAGLLKTALVSCDHYDFETPKRIQNIFDEMGMNIPTRPLGIITRYSSQQINHSS